MYNLDAVSSRKATSDPSTRKTRGPPPGARRPGTTSFPGRNPSSIRRRAMSSGRSSRSITQRWPLGNSASVRGDVRLSGAAHLGIPIDIRPFQYYMHNSRRLKKLQAHYEGAATVSAKRAVDAGYTTFQCYDQHVLRDRSQHFMLRPDREPGGCYDRKQVCRLLKIEGRQLKNWERQRLIPELTEYRFSDLLSLKTIVRLRSEKCRPKAIRQALGCVASPPAQCAGWAC